MLLVVMLGVSLTRETGSQTNQTNNEYLWYEAENMRGITETRGMNLN